MSSSDGSRWREMERPQAIQLLEAARPNSASSDGIRALQAVEKRGTPHVAPCGLRVVCGPTQLVEICRAHRWVALLHQALVGDGLGLDVGDGGVPALAVVAVEHFLSGLALDHSRQL